MKRELLLSTALLGIPVVAARAQDASSPGIATTALVGLVKPDGVTITINNQGVIAAVAGGGGQGQPGGTTGQVQYNAGAGVFGGFTASGDATINTSTGAVAVSSIGGKAVNLAGALSTGGGAYSVTFQLVGNTLVTVPMTGTLATTSQLGSYLPLAGGDVTGAVTLGGGATIAGGESLSGGLKVDSVTATGGMSGTTLSLSSAETVGGALSVTGGATIASAASLGGGATITSGFHTDNVTVSGAASVTGAANFGATTINGSVSVTGAQTFNGNQVIIGTESVTGASTLTGGVYMGGALTVTSGYVSNGAATVNGSFYAGATTITGAASVTGATSLNAVTIAGASSIVGAVNFGNVITGFTTLSGGTVNISGSETIGGAITIGGAASFAGVIQGFTTLSGGTVNITGSETVGGAITVGGAAAFASGINTTTLVATNVTVSGTETVGGAATLGGGLTTTTLNASGAATVAGSLNVGTASVAQELNLIGPSSSYRGTQIFTGSSQRWFFGANGTPEAGGNAGSDFQIINYSDAGAVLGTPITVFRSTGAVNLSNNLTVVGGAYFIAGAAITGGALTSGGAAIGTSPAATFYQNSNGGDAITVIRETDTSPTGYFLRGINTSTTSTEFYIDVSGNFSTLGAIQAISGANISGGTTVAGGITATSGFINGTYATITPAGSTQGAATPITTQFTNLGAASAAGAILPVTPAGTFIFIFNASGASQNIYPAVGANLNGGTTNIPIALANLTGLLFWSYGTGNYSYH